MRSEEQTSESSEEGKIVGRRRRSKRDGARMTAAFDEAKRSVETVAEDLRERVEEHPWRALGLALGAGYIVGGGLFTGLTGRILFTGIRIGVRLAALPLVREELMGFVEDLADRGRGETERRHQ